MIHNLLPTAITAGALALLLVAPGGSAPGDSAPRDATDPPLQKPGWRLTFHDEFDGNRLDTRKWNDRYWDGRTHSNNELEYYAPDGYEVKGGTLRLKGERRRMEGHDYTSGMIASLGHFAQQYGYFEIRAKFPRGKGFWPAFWLLPVTKQWPPEIDILEILGHQPEKIYFSTHFHDERGQHQYHTDSWIGPDFSKGFHTIALEWNPGEVIWYVDGVERARSRQGVPAEPMYLIANLAVGGDWPGNPDAGTPFPGVMEIDYIRVYERDAARR